MTAKVDHSHQRGSLEGVEEGESGVRKKHGRGKSVGAGARGGGRLRWHFSGNLGLCGAADQQVPQMKSNTPA